MSALAPGGFSPGRDRWGSFSELAASLGPGALVVADRRVLRLHPRVEQALAHTRPLTVVKLTAGEKAKSLTVLEAVLGSGVQLPRSGTLLCVGGGTVGDLATVAAHLLKRGVKLIQVPTTLLAAVDSSVGGKGAVHLTLGNRQVKNGAGVFHYAAESWLCPELFETLSARQLREGRIEAWKMAACLDARRYHAYLRQAPSAEQLIRDARALKRSVCAADPYERAGLRAVLNFGHTFGHVIESLTSFRVSHGEAVGLGVLCALDVGVALAVTAPALAREVEATFLHHVGSGGRTALARALVSGSEAKVSALLGVDKKAGAGGELNMVLLSAVGKASLHRVPPACWKHLLSLWRRG